MKIVENMWIAISVQESIANAQRALFTFLLFYLFTFQGCFFTFQKSLFTRSGYQKRRRSCISTSVCELRSICCSPDDMWSRSM